VGYSRCNGGWRESRLGVQLAGTRGSPRLPSMALAAARRPAHEQQAAFIAGRTLDGAS
jgi:hypothetical protein